ncbi:hypothetical protein OG413_42425 [Streptomyces sp. NBC_01433]|uniref:hypothetical protein n=1 Tax=Streptomyces sp. NBC_01433 TaxID=2903864 RepID=UPI0022581642|nr:hypothetical protein [Streptomyces sp. NBC_01433]MCX4681863.1 hypothetical protein [Streptomyces sp. NBC_01433]
MIVVSLNDRAAPQAAPQTARQSSEIEGIDHGTQGTRHSIRRCGRGDRIRFAAAACAPASAQAAAAVNYQVINGNSSNSCLQVVDTSDRQGKPRPRHL